MKTPFKKSKGMITLLSAIVILVLLSIMVIFAAKVGVFDQRMAANEARYKEAFATAEAGLDFAVQRFDNQFRAAGAFTGLPSMATIIYDLNYDSTDGLHIDVVSLGRKVDGSKRLVSEKVPSFTVAITDTGSVLPGPEGIAGLPVYEFESTGIGADGTGTATVIRQLSMGQTLGGGAPDVPVIVDGSVATGGDFNIVANPNGGGPGVPVAIWTPTPGGDVEMSGSSATCHREFYSGNNPQCNNPSGKSELLSQGDGSTRTTYDATFPDILPNDTSFPSDLFPYLFGVARANWAVIKAKAANHGQVKSDCSGIGTTAGATFALWWIEGDCLMGASQVIGSLANPVILVIDDHELDMGGGGANIYGIAYLFNNPDNVLTPSGDFHGTPAIYGGLISDVGGAAMQGSYSIIHEQTLFENLTSEGSRNYDLAYMPGSWRDY